MEVKLGKSLYGLGGGLVSNDLVGLRPFLPLNNVELYLIAFFQTLVPIDLDGAVMDKYVGPVVSSDKAVTLRIIKPFDLTLVLSHEPCPSLKQIAVGETPTCLIERRGIGRFGFPSRVWRTSMMANGKGP